MNLHPSRAGIGKRLNTQRLILIIAHNISINITQADIEFVIKSDYDYDNDENIPDYAESSRRLAFFLNN